MDAVEFIKAINRLCEAQEDCKECPLIGHACDVNTATIMSYYNIESVQKMVRICEQWSKDHPVKTRQSEFLKMFPNTQMNVEGDVIWMCPKYIDESYRPKENCQDIRCSNCKREYWLEEVSE